MGAYFKQKEQVTVDHLLGRYWSEYARYLKSGNSAVKSQCAHILKHFGKATVFSEITDADVSAFKAKLRAKLSNSTVNRVLSTLRKIHNTAKDEWEYAVPDVKFKQHMLKEPEARTRWLTNEEAEKLIENAAEHLKKPIRFALLTGVRLSNILNLQWEHINFEQNEIEFRIKSNIPGGKLLVLPMSKELRALLGSCDPHQEGNVFLRYFKPDKLTGEQREPEPIKKFRRSFKTACDGAGIKNFRFHDLRHTAATWMVQNGVPLDLVQEVLGHTDIGTTKKYAHRDFSEKKTALEKLATAQIRHIELPDDFLSQANPLKLMVGARGFEPPTPSPPDWCANRAALRPDKK